MRLVKILRLKKLIFFTTQEEMTVSQDELKLLNTNGEVSIYIVGLVTYTDAYNNRIYTTEFCSAYFGTDPTTWHICDSHNLYR